MSRPPYIMRLPRRNRICVGNSAKAPRIPKADDYDAQLMRLRAQLNVSEPAACRGVDPTEFERWSIGDDE